MEHEVWASTETTIKPVYRATFTQDRWQWAEKLARRLREKGATDVEVRDVDDILERDDDEEEEE